MLVVIFFFLPLYVTAAPNCPQGKFISIHRENVQYQIYQPCGLYVLETPKQIMQCNASFFTFISGVWGAQVYN